MVATSTPSNLAPNTGQLITNKVVTERLNALRPRTVHLIKNNSLVPHTLREGGLAPVVRSTKELINHLQTSASTWIVVDYTIDEAQLHLLHQQEGPHTTVFVLEQ